MSASGKYLHFLAISSHSSTPPPLLTFASPPPIGVFGNGGGEAVSLRTPLVLLPLLASLSLGAIAGWNRTQIAYVQLGRSVTKVGAALVKKRWISQDWAI